MSADLEGNGLSGADLPLLRACPPLAEFTDFTREEVIAADEMLLVVDTVLGMVDLEVLDDQGLLDRDLADQVTLHVYSRPDNDVRLRVVPLGARNLDCYSSPPR